MQYLTYCHPYKKIGVLYCIEQKKVSRFDVTHTRETNNALMSDYIITNNSLYQFHLTWAACVCMSLFHSTFVHFYPFHLLIELTPKIVLKVVRWPWNFLFIFTSSYFLRCCYLICVCVVCVWFFFVRFHSVNVFIHCLHCTFVHMLYIFYTYMLVVCLIQAESSYFTRFFFLFCFLVIYFLFL